MDIARFIGDYSVVFLTVLSVLSFLLLFFVKWKGIMRVFAPIRASTWALLSIILILAAMVRVFIFPTLHLMYIDEHLYMEEAKNIIGKGKAINCHFEEEEVCVTFAKKSRMWPFTLSLAYRIFGDSPLVAFWLAKALSILTIALVFLFLYALSNREWVGLWCSLLLALSPWQAIWSNTVETNIPLLFFIALTLICAVLCQKTRDIFLGINAVFFLMFSIFLRYESIVLLPIMALIFFLDKKIQKTQRTNGTTLLELFFPSIIMVMGAAVVASSIIGWVIFRAMDTSFLKYFYFLRLPFFLEEVSLGFILLLPSVYGAIRLWENKTMFSYVALPFFLYSLVYLPFSNEPRMLIVPQFFLYMVFAFGVESFIANFPIRTAFLKTSFLTTSSLMAVLRGVAFLIIILAVLSSFLNLPFETTFGKNKDLYFLETSFGMALKGMVPTDCYLISAFTPITQATTDTKGMQTSYALNNVPFISTLIQNGNCVYYYANHYCYLGDSGRIDVDGKTPRECQKMQEKFDLITHAQSSKGNFTFTLYRLGEASMDRIGLNTTT